MFIKLTKYALVGLALTIGASLDARVNRALFEERHPDWEDVTKTEEFRRYTLNGGPTEEDYFSFVRGGQQGDYLEHWQAEYPDWWREKGTVGPRYTCDQHPTKNAKAAIRRNSPGSKRRSHHCFIRR